MGLDDVAQSLRVENESRTVQEQGTKKRDQSLWKNKVDQLWLMRGEQILNIIAATNSSHFTRDFTHAPRSNVSGPVSANMTRNWCFSSSHRSLENTAAESVQKRSDCAATRLLTTLFTGEAIVTRRSCMWKVESGLKGIGTRRATVEVKDLTKITCPSLSKI